MRRKKGDGFIGFGSGLIGLAQVGGLVRAVRGPPQSPLCDFLLLPILPDRLGKLSRWPPMGNRVDPSHLGQVSTSLFDFVSPLLVGGQISNFLERNLDSGPYGRRLYPQGLGILSGSHCEFSVVCPVLALWR